jgi:DNA/RNA-binding domain of Phe-tRNA-synthetase-like protein
MIFNYHPDIRAKYPNLVGGIVVAHGVKNSASSPELLAAYHAEQQATLKRIGETPLSQIEALAAWRGAFRSFGVDPTQIRSACEALLRRLTKQGDIPSINALVDIGNLVSIRYALPVAMVDTRSLTGEITVCFADGTEKFTNLGQEEVTHPDPGEVIFVDDAGLVFARRWCWRQSDQSAARENTTDLLVTVEAQHAGGREAVEAAVRDLSALIEQYTDSTPEAHLVE